MGGGGFGMVGAAGWRLVKLLSGGLTPHVATLGMLHASGHAMRGKASEFMLSMLLLAPLPCRDKRTFDALVPLLELFEGVQ
jgi:hypothetical protein